MGLNMNEAVLKLPLSSLNTEGNIKYYEKILIFKYYERLWLYKHPKEEITPSVKCWTQGIFLIMEICNTKDSMVTTWMGFPLYSQNNEGKQVRKEI